MQHSDAVKHRKTSLVKRLKTAVVKVATEECKLLIGVSNLEATHKASRSLSLINGIKI